MANIAVIYYSSTGSVHELAKAVEEGAKEKGADTRLRKVAETAPEEAIASRDSWKEHHEATKDLPGAELDDLVWADGYILGTPTRYGNPAAQLKAFIDSAGGVWQKGELQDKVAAGFTSTTTIHGGQESTLLALYTVFMHWGSLIAPPGYTDPHQFVVGNPYGASHWDQQGEKLPDEDALKAARYLGGRVAELAQKLRG